MKRFKKYWRIGTKNKSLIVVLVIFILELFLRFYQIDQRSPFGYDQVDNAWAAKNIIVNHSFPLVGFVAKGNTGIYIGPLYYYLISIVYFIFDLNPISSGVFAGITSIFTFWSIFYVVKKLFSWKIATIAVFINTIAFNAIMFDRVQTPVNFIPGISILIFYLLYKVITKDTKYLIPLSVIIGLSFHIHFTSIFYSIIVLSSSIFFMWNRRTLRHILISIPLCLIWLVPNIIAQINGNSQSSHLMSYISTYYHGFHLRRMMQLIGDAIIQFDSYLFFDKIKPFKIIILPLFFLVYFWKSISKGKLKFSYLVILWFLVPWVVFTAYRGEISDYYFRISAPIALMIISYLIFRLFSSINLILKIVMILVFSYYVFSNMKQFLNYKGTGFQQGAKNVLEQIREGERIGYKRGASESYLYYYYMRKKDVNVY